ncbi:hypothetical protein HDK77DRAFT_291444 [Phyllosticta capitalensis]
MLQHVRHSALGVHNLPAPRCSFFRKLIRMHGSPRNDLLMGCGWNCAPRADARLSPQPVMHNDQTGIPTPSPWPAPVQRVRQSVDQLGALCCPSCRPPAVVAYAGTWVPLCGILQNRHVEPISSTVVLRLFTAGLGRRWTETVVQGPSCFQETFRMTTCLPRLVPADACSGIPTFRKCYEIDLAYLQLQAGAASHEHGLFWILGSGAMPSPRRR